MPATSVLQGSVNDSVFLTNPEFFYLFLFLFFKEENIKRVKNRKKKKMKK